MRISDWSPDVCSSDLRQLARTRRHAGPRPPQRRFSDPADPASIQRDADLRRPHDQHPADPALTPAPIRQGEPMKITDIRFGMLRVPLKTPFKTALRTVETVEDIVVSIHTDTGHVGYGEAPATAVITGDTHGSIVSAINKFIAPRLIGEEIANLNRITRLGDI